MKKTPEQHFFTKTSPTGRTSSLETQFGLAFTPDPISTNLQVRKTE